MPHGSGGFSGGGGGGFRGFRGGYSSLRRGKRYIAGSRIHLYDPNDGTDRYLGTASLANTNKNFARTITVTTILAVILSCILSLGFKLSANKLTTNPSIEPVINDYAGVIADKDILMDTLNEYRELTGIVPVVYTVYDEDWKTSNTGKLSGYAMEKYLATADDEFHFVVVYSVPKNDTAAVNGGLKGASNRISAVQGNYTDPILTTAMYWKFICVVKLGRLKGEDPGKAINDAFKFAIKDANIKLNPTAGNKILTLSDNIPLMINLLVFLVIYIVEITRYVRERKAGYEMLRNDPRFE